MAKIKKVTFDFNITKEEKGLYEKYGIPATELAKDKEFLAASKLMDKILKDHPKCEFALILKSNYLFNYYNQNVDYGNLEIDDFSIIKKKAEDFKKKLIECVDLINQALKINPKNERAKSLKDFIENNSLKNCNNLLGTIKKTKGNFPKKANKSLSIPLTIPLKLICPYCKLENYSVIIKRSDDECECPKCKKFCKIFVGTVKSREGHFRTASFGPPPYKIRLLTLNEEIKSIFFTSDSVIDVNSGDLIVLVYKKKFLSHDYSDKPHLIINSTLGSYFYI